METFYRAAIEFNHISPAKYEMLMDFLEDNDIDYFEYEYDEYTVDTRSDRDKYEDWLAEQADIAHDEEKMGLR